MKIAYVAAFGVAGLALAALAGVGRPEPALGFEPTQTQPQARSDLTVNGTGSVTTVPDRAELSFGVVSEAGTARAALAANAAEMRRVIDALRNAGVAADDIQTQQISLSPRSSDDGSRIVGYTAQNSVGARLRDLDRAGAVIDAAVAAGANTVSGPSLIRSDRAELYRTALRAAVADARAKAQTLAVASNVTVGRVLNVVESGEAPPPQPVAEASRAQDAPTPVEPGTQTIEANVTVVFAIT
jgi:uncharacterized protein YggE